MRMLCYVDCKTPGCRGQVDSCNASKERMTTRVVGRDESQGDAKDGQEMGISRELMMSRES